MKKTTVIASNLLSIELFYEHAPFPYFVLIVIGPWQSSDL